jgi:hypothetical protein
MTQKARPNTTRRELLVAEFIAIPQAKDNRPETHQYTHRRKEDDMRDSEIAQRGCAYERGSLESAAVRDEQQQIASVLGGRISIKWPTHGRW